MTLRTAATITAVAVFSAYGAAGQSPEARARSLKQWDICVEAGRLMRKRKRDEPYFDAVIARARREFNLNGIDLMGAPDRRPMIGMSACGLFAALGKPDRLNRTEQRSGTSAQWVYDAPHRYIYTDENQIVTTIQD